MSGLAIKVYNNPLVSVPASTEAAQEILCGCFSGCFFEELVFADNLASGDAWKADQSSFLTSKIVSSDVATFHLYKNGSLIANITDNTYGTFYDFGDFTNQPLYTGFVADWTLIQAAFSGGLYNIKIESTILGTANTFESRDFRLNIYDSSLAHRTVKLETYQDGNILGNELDFTDLIEGGWYDSIRLPATFGNKTPILEVDNYFDTSYTLYQNRPSVVYEYTLLTDLIPETLASQISSNNILGNTILLTSENQNNDEQLRRVPVVVESFEDTNYFDNGKLRYSIKFKDRTQNLIKRNF